MARFPSLDTRSVRVLSLERHDDTAPEFTVVQMRARGRMSGW